MSVKKIFNLRTLFNKFSRTMIHGEHVRCEWDGFDAFSVKLGSGYSLCLASMMQAFEKFGYKIRDREYTVEQIGDGAIRSTQMARKDLHCIAIVVEIDGNANVTKTIVRLV